MYFCYETPKLFVVFFLTRFEQLFKKLGETFKEISRNLWKVYREATISIFN